MSSQDQEPENRLEQLQSNMQTIAAVGNVSPDAQFLAARIEASTLQIVDALDGVGERIAYMIDQTR